MIKRSSSVLNDITNVIQPLVNSPTGKLVVGKTYIPDFMKADYEPFKMDMLIAGDDVAEKTEVVLIDEENKASNDTSLVQEHTTIASDELLQWNDIDPQLRIQRKTRNGLVFRPFKDFSNVKAKDTICQWIIDKVFTRKEIQRRYLISSKNITCWLRKYKTSGKNELRGRAKKIDDIRKGKIVLAVEEAEKDHLHLPEEFVDGMMDVAAYARAAEMGKLEGDIGKMGLSKSTRWKLKKELGLKARATNDSTISRLTACKDPFPSVAWAAINWGMASRLSADFKANADATTIFFL
jgi:transposase